MTLRLGLTARLAAIVFAFLLTVWVGLIVLHYQANGLDRAATRPGPSQLAAIVDVVSAAAPIARPRLLEAIASPSLTATIEAPNEPITPLVEPPGEAEDRAAYAAALGDRLLDFGRIRRGGMLSDSGRLLPGARAATRIRLRLDDGEVLRIDVRTPFVVTRYGQPAGLGAGLLGTVFALVAFVLLHREIRPLTRLAAAVDRLDPYGDPVRLPRISARAPETAALFGAIDRLQTRLHALVRSRFALISGVQHDVRSFATRLRLRVEAIADPVERDKAAADITDMIELLDTALLTARAGVGALTEEMLDLAALVGEEIGDLAAAGWAVSLGAIPRDREVTVIADRVAMRRILANLVDNAVLYGDEARVDVTATAEEAVIAVGDRGPGMTPEEADLLFEPFVRAEPSRARSTGGAGLGLAVVRNLVEAQQGTITVGRTETGGARVELRFPIFTP